MKQIRNWKIIAEHLNVITALDILKNQKMDNHIGPFAIGHEKTKKFVTRYLPDQAMTSEEIIVNGWRVFVPDNDEENKNNKIRNFAKESNCSGLTHDKIDNMTNKEIWRHLCSKMDNDQIYRMLLLYYENKIYKTK